MGDLTNGVGIFLLTQSILSIEKKKLTKIIIKYPRCKKVGSQSTVRQKIHQGAILNLKINVHLLYPFPDFLYCFIKQKESELYATLDNLQTL